MNQNPSRMKQICCWFPAVLILVANPVMAADEGDSPLKAIKWTHGPATAPLGQHAEIKVPKDFIFAMPSDAQKLLRMMGNPTDGSELGLLGPTNLDWFVVFEFSDVGYVKDDDKDKLDPAKMLTSFRRGTEASNKEREKMGVPPMRIVGWEQEPRYNESTHNLEWAIRGESEGKPILNWNTRLLGRHGVMEVNLVVEPEHLQATMPTYQGILQDFQYKAGERYAEYRQGDKVAKYGLAALVLGGAAVGAAKLGLFAALAAFLKKGWKLLVIGVVAIGAWIKRLVTGDGRQRTE